MRLSEIYTSVQGEGPNTGHPIQFVRFGGCNMRCPGWPCDTVFAIDPKFADTWDSVTAEQVFSRLWMNPHRICITGGEPLTQRSSEMDDFVKLCLTDGFSIDLFTNGSMILPHWVFNARVTVVMDWKLEGSGEGQTGYPNRVANAKVLHRKDAIKFVVVDRQDLHEAARVTRDFAMADVQASLWVGAAWGRITPEEVIDFILEENLPWRLNVQTHKYIWKPDERGV